MLLLDSSGVLAALNPSERSHRSCARALATASEPLLLSPFVLAELDYLVTKRVGEGASSRLLDQVGIGAYQLEPFTADDVAECCTVMQKYPGIGLADSSIVVLANRHSAADVLTLDERHFRRLRDAHNRPFRLLPADAVS